MLFALLNVFTLIPSQHLNPYVMAFMRYLFGTLILLPIVMKLGLYRSLRTDGCRCTCSAAPSMPPA